MDESKKRKIRAIELPLVVRKGSIPQVCQTRGESVKPLIYVVILRF